MKKSKGLKKTMGSDWLKKAYGIYIRDGFRQLMRFEQYLSAVYFWEPLYNEYE